MSLPAFYFTLYDRVLPYVEQLYRSNEYNKKPFIIVVSYYVSFGEIKMRVVFYGLDRQWIKGVMARLFLAIFL